MRFEPISYKDKVSIYGKINDILPEIPNNTMNSELVIFNIYHLWVISHEIADLSIATND
ncbi:hypothetical protein [Mucilaginibacter sp.]|uniref:hypothetical protein n=1 Tax=Mucilaginibacter sp. TaxID=1882438 RepID=UPI0025DFA0AC|nr:hypothetical protein [Mucilaginibacter sp.]